ncbi:hypothetical protein [Desulfurobacterium thermolithotrophum]|jgi:hypothetical protein|uniref:hypothetical protein n=1 Tax=Desulfurobacterium thermolithotrophum TaxID=64160 RepID=UPI0013D2B941|nr:hypothetical protein [Desulfurobacterium thermolithotrophum]
MARKTRLKKFDRLPDHIKQEIIKLRREGRTFEYLEDYLQEKYGIEISYKSIWNWFKDKQNMFDVALAFGENLDSGELLTATKGLSFAMIGIYQQLVFVLDQMAEKMQGEGFNPEVLKEHITITKEAINTLSNFMRASAYAEKTQAELEQRYAEQFEEMIEKLVSRVKQEFQDKPDVAEAVINSIKELTVEH